MSKNTKKIQELYDKIKEWGEKNGIIQNAKANIQFLKTISEKSEISKAFLEDDKEEFKDAIGDTFVTIVMVTEIIKKDNNVKLNLSKLNEDKNVKTILLNLTHLDVILGEVADAIAKNQMEKAVEFLNESLPYLSNLSLENGLEFNECVEAAYNVIKDRTGFLTPDGTFVKSTDDNYEEIVNKYSKNKKAKKGE